MIHTCTYCTSNQRSQTNSKILTQKTGEGSNVCGVCLCPTVNVHICTISHAISILAKKCCGHSNQQKKTFFSAAENFPQAFLSCIFSRHKGDRIIPVWNKSWFIHTTEQADKSPKQNTFWLWLETNGVYIVANLSNCLSEQETFFMWV